MRWPHVVLLGLACVSCGNPGPYGTHQSFTSEDGDWRLSYLDPPWELVDPVGPPVVFRIPSNAARVVGLDAAVMPRYELRVTVERGDPRARAERDERRAGSRDEVVEVATRPVQTRSGDTGFEVITRSTEIERRYSRFVYLDHPTGVLRLFFDSVPDAGEPEVDAMIESVQVLAE